MPKFVAEYLLDILSYFLVARLPKQINQSIKNLSIIATKFTFLIMAAGPSHACHDSLQAVLPLSLLILTQEIIARDTREYTVWLANIYVNETHVL